MVYNTHIHAVNYISYNMYFGQQYWECTKWVSNFNNTSSLIDKLYFVNVLFLLNCCIYYNIYAINRQFLLTIFYSHDNKINKYPAIIGVYCIG